MRKQWNLELTRILRLAVCYGFVIGWFAGCWRSEGRRVHKNQRMRRGRVSTVRRGDAALNQRTGFAAVLWSACLAMLAVGVNSTAIMAALPSMRTELGLSSAGVE